jgi:tRNA pseudouridine32 synthase/23S rRNA pseudouridine746 synthase
MSSRSSIRYRLAPRDGLIGCRVVLAPGPAPTLIAALCQRYPNLAPKEWQARFARGHVFDSGGQPLAADAPFKGPRELHYYREFAETRIPVEERILHIDAELVVVDKPHFLPVVPAGRYRRETLVLRLIERLANAELSPLHRLDRNTAGLVLFSARRGTRARYQALFRERRIEKRYEAIAPPLPGLEFPLERRSRLERHRDGFRMQEVAGEPNTLTRIEVLERGATRWRYALHPHTGRMHQLRVHMAALGAPIENDLWYPDAAAPAADDFDRPLRLLAQALAFVDPLSGAARRFESQLRLEPAI